MNCHFFLVLISFLHPDLFHAGKRYNLNAVIWIKNKGWMQGIYGGGGWMAFGEKIEEFVKKLKRGGKKGENWINNGVKALK